MSLFSSLYFPRPYRKSEPQHDAATTLFCHGDVAFRRFPFLFFYKIILSFACRSKSHILVSLQLLFREGRVKKKDGGKKTTRHFSDYLFIFFIKTFEIIVTFLPVHNNVALCVDFHVKSQKKTHQSLQSQ